MKSTTSSQQFTNFAKATSRATGRPLAFMLAVATIVVWLVNVTVGWVLDRVRE